MARREMRLTADLVARVPPTTGNHSAEEISAGRRFATDSDHREVARDILGQAPSPADVWVFAYGSLIWNPCFEFVEQRAALTHGWHRSFCLGWDTWFRGSIDRPGLMLALDRGGRCSGVAFRLPEDTAYENLVALAQREVHLLPPPFVPRWVDATTGSGPIRALTFVIDRRSDAYVAGLPPEEVARALASAAGQTGSMAEYLFNTVSKLHELGIRDRHLWRMQELVANCIETAHPG